jgi:uncharacterized integral membrane protein
MREKPKNGTPSETVGRSSRAIMAAPMLRLKATKRKKISWPGGRRAKPHTRVKARAVDTDDRSVGVSEEDAMAVEPSSPPASDAHATAPQAERGVESRAGRLARHGRRVRFWSLAILFIALFAVLVGLISANTRAVKLDWVVGSTHASLDWIVLAAAVLGWLLGITTAVVVRHRTRRPG